MLSPISLSIDTLSGSPLPVDISLLREHVATDGTDSDTLLTQNLLAAVLWAEGAMRRTVFARRHIWTLRDFPRYGSQVLQLPRGKTQSITSIAYTLGGSVQTLLGPSSSPVGTSYQELLSGHQGAFLRPPQGSSWPSVDVEAVAPVQITFIAGWLSSEVPKNVLQAILFAAEDMFDLRGDADLAQAGANLNGRYLLVSPHRIQRWY